MDLGVVDWPVAGTTHTPLSSPAAGPVEEGAPAWWGSGENTNQFLLEQGIVLP